MRILIYVLITFVLLNISFWQECQASIQHNESFANHLYIDAVADANMLRLPQSEHEDQTEGMAVFHLFSHGQSGSLFLESDWLKENKYLQNKSYLNIYNCNFAQDEKGRAPVTYLEADLGVLGAASDDVTGVDEDCELEVGKSNNVVILPNHSYNLKEKSVWEEWWNWLREAFSFANSDREMEKERNTHTPLTGNTNTLTIAVTPADGGASEKVWFTNDMTCADTVIIKRSLPCPSDVATCASTPGCIGGNVFEDFNFNGTDDTNEPGVEGVQIQVYDCNNNLVGTSYSDSQGDWQVCGLTDGTAYRIEHILPEAVAFWAKPTHVGSDNGSDIQFLTAPAETQFSVSNPQDYCQENPKVLVPCFVAGDVLSGEAIYDTFDAFIGFDHSSNANSTAGLNKIAFASEIGSTWGVAYQKRSTSVFTSAVLKRHFGFGTIDGINATTGGIYAIDVENIGSPTVSKWLDVNAIGINTGANPRDGSAANSLSALPSTPSYDAAAYTQVGKVGIGDIDMQDDHTLWLVNLNDRSLYGIQNIDPNTTPIASDVLGPFSLPNTGCGSGEQDVRPWGLTVHQGKVYVGAICSGETSQDSLDLHAYIFEFDPISQSMSIFYDFDMNYERGTIDVGGSHDTGDWRTWQTTWPSDICKRPEGFGGNQSCNGRRTNMQPILSDIEFDADGSLIIGIMDRWGMQTQDDFYSPDPTASDTENYWLFIAPGDILRVCNVDGSYVFEGGTGCLQSPSNTNGGGGNEYYHGDHGTKSNTSVLRETALGALLYLQGDDEVMITQWDPYITYNSGGTSTLFNSTGNFNRRQLVYGRTSIGPIPPPPSDGYAAKGIGLGDLEARCDLAQLEIGNYVWCDSLENGIQDACERGINDIIVQLYDRNGNLVGQDTTSKSGQYYFNKNNVDTTGITVNGSGIASPVTSWSGMSYSTQYFIVFGGGQFATNEFTVGSQTYGITSMVNAGSNDNIDSDVDGASLTSGSLGARPDGLPFIEMTTSATGCGDHKYDMGVTCNSCTLTDAGKTLETCHDNGTNSDSSDDYITFSLNPVGTDLGATYSVTADNGGTVTLAGGGAATGVSYGSATAFRLQNGSADGATTFTITVTDVDDGACTVTTTVLQNDCSVCPPKVCLPITTTIKQGSQ